MGVSRHSPMGAAERDCLFKFFGNYGLWEEDICVDFRDLFELDVAEHYGGVIFNQSRLI